MIGYNKSEIVGKMRERVILQNRIITQSDSGFQSEIYNDIGIYWSKIEYKTGFEEEDADKITNQQKINITLRYNILVNVNSRFVYRNELYQVEKVEYSDDRRFMTCVCVWRSSYTSIYAGSIFCSASLLAQSNLSAALMSVIKYQASLNAFGSVSADISFVQKVASSLNANASLISNLQLAKTMESSITASSLLISDLKIAKTFESSLNANGTLVSNATIAKNLASSLTSSNSLAASALVSKLASASLTGAGTTAANLTVTSSASFLLDLYPNAAVAYSLRKLRTAYTGSAIRVRRSSDNTEQDIGFDVNGNLDTVSLLAFCGVGNGFVQTWYDQSGNARNFTQTTQANQPQIVSNGIINNLNNKPTIISEPTKNWNNTFGLLGNLYSLFMTYYKTTTGDQPIIGQGPTFIWLDYRLTQYISLTGTLTIASNLPINTQMSINTIADFQTGATMYKNNTVIGSRGSYSSNMATATEFPYKTGRTANLHLQEFIYYSTNQNSNRSGIENNINLYYAIY